jgi:L-fuculose-phosphate aldolase
MEKSDRMSMAKALDRLLFKEFQNIGRDMFLRGLVSSHAGNMSIRTGETIHITRRASMLGQLKRTDVISLNLTDNSSPLIGKASSEVSVHKAIYDTNTSALAVIHAHTPYATLLSMTEDEIVPIDFEGSYLFKEVPVICLGKSVGSDEAALLISEPLKEYKIILVRGHGSFARGDTLEEAYMLTSSLESSSFFVYYSQSREKEREQRARK